jgi:Flp pilus assembly protein TadB
MADPTSRETRSRWKALEPSGRRRLLINRVLLLMTAAAIYAFLAAIAQSLWVPAVVIALSMLTSSLVKRVRRTRRGRG